MRIAISGSPSLGKSTLAIDIDDRDEVDAIFKDIYRRDRFHLMPERNSPALIEIWGSREKRLLRLEQAIAWRADQLSGG